MLLITNATVRVLRSGVQVGPDSIDVMLDPGAMHFTAMGGQRFWEVLFPTDADVRQTDDIEVLTFNKRVFGRPGPYEAQDVYVEGGFGLDVLCVRLIGFTL